MNIIGIGHRVRVNIPDSDDPDHKFHGKTGEVIDISQDDLGIMFDDPRLKYLIKVKFDDDELGTMTFRLHDLKSE